MLKTYIIVVHRVLIIRINLKSGINNLMPGLDENFLTYSIALKGCFRIRTVHGFMNI